MSSTQFSVSSHSVTDILIVSHGYPTDPEPQEQFIRSLSQKVAAKTGLKVQGATLAKTGALYKAITEMEKPVIFPYFMSDGWFVSVNLQNRIAATGLKNWRTLKPLGLLSDLPHLSASVLKEQLLSEGMTLGRTKLIIAGHGSPTNPKPAHAVRQFAEAMRLTSLFSEVRVGFVDETPSLTDAFQVNGDAVILPFFAALAGHVLNDLPCAIDAANFKGLVLEPIGTWEQIPTLVSQSLQKLEMLTNTEQHRP